MMIAVAFMALSIADFATTVLGLSMGLVEAGGAASIMRDMTISQYALFRIGSAAIALLLFKCTALVFSKLEGAELLLKAWLFVLTVLLALVVVNNVVKIWMAA